MPIGDQEWKNANKTAAPVKIAREFLEDEYPEAYTPTEIVAEDKSLSNISQQQAVVKQLIQGMNVLSAIGTLELKVVENDDGDNGDGGGRKTYYRAVKD